MIDPKMYVSWQLIFNNTGAKWENIQAFIVETLEKKYTCLHCVPKKYNEEYPDNYKEIDGIPCMLYLKMNKDEMRVDCIVCKVEKKAEESEVSE